MHSMSIVYSRRVCLAAPAAGAVLRFPQLTAAEEAAGTKRVLVDEEHPKWGWCNDYLTEGEPALKGGGEQEQSRGEASSVTKEGRRKARRSGLKTRCSRSERGLLRVYVLLSISLDRPVKSASL